MTNSNSTSSNKFLEIFDELKGYKEGQIYYLTSGGNAGDALINASFYILAKRNNIKFKQIKPEEQYPQFNKNDILLIAGGGTIVADWDSIPNAITTILKHYVVPKIIILPQSIYGINTLINQFPTETIVFCREKRSFDYCKSNGHKNSFIEEDLALKLDINELNKQEAIRPKTTLKNLIRHVLFYLHYFRSKVLRRKEIKAFRTDKESTRNQHLWYIINDLSLIASFGQDNEKETFYTAKKFLELLDLYDTIYTDRLHITIGGYLLNKKVIIFDNKYGKCSGVYEESLRDKENIQLEERKK